MAKTKLRVKQDPENEIAVEVIAKAVADISVGIKKLRAGPLNDKALLLLIQHATPTQAYSGARIGVGVIKDVLEGIESLEKIYIKKAK